MINTPDENLKIKIIVPIILTFCALVAVTLYVSFYNLRTALHEELDSKGTAIAAVLATNYQDIHSKDGSTIQSYIDDYKKIPGVSYVFVRDENEEFIAHTFSPGVPDQFKKRHLKTKDSKITSQLINFKSYEVIDITAPILNGVLGEVHIGMNLSEVTKNAMAPILSWVSLVGVFFALICVGFLYLSITKITNRLSRFNVELEKSQKIIVNQQQTLVDSAKMSALGEMAGSIAHEINTPLAVILMRTEQMEDSIKTGEIETADFEHSIRVIKKTVERIAKIVTGLRMFASGGRGAAMQPTRLSSIIEDTLSFCTERLKRHGIEIQNPHADLEILCRSVEISQVLLNLLNNACDAIQDKPNKWVRVAVVDLGAEAELSVTDCGGGISRELREKIMQPFFTTKEIGKGTGLGLSISKGILDEHRGKIFLDYESVNTRFVIVVPKPYSVSAQSVFKYSST